VLKNAVGGISDIIHIPGLVNVDFEDVKTVMSEPGKAMMGTARPAARTAPPRPPTPPWPARCWKAST
jgi:cell division GTPase FtsZ